MSTLAHFPDAVTNPSPSFPHLGPCALQLERKRLVGQLDAAHGVWSESLRALNAAKRDEYRTLKLRNDRLIELEVPVARGYLAVVEINWALVRLGRCVCEVIS